MSRLQALVAQPRTALGALLTLLLAAGAVAGSGADFTASSANPTNTFSAGTLTIGNSKDATAILTAANMRPGDPAADGHGGHHEHRLAERRVHARRAARSPTRTPATRCRRSSTWSSPTCVATCGDGDDTPKYTGTLAAMGQDIALGTYAAGAKHRYRFAVALDSSATNAYQGDNSTAEFDFNAA